MKRITLRADERELVAFLRDLRRDRRISTERLAAQIGVTRQSLFNWEHLLASPTLHHAALWAKALGLQELYV